MGLLWLLLVALSLNLSHYGVVRGKIFSQEEDLELERQLKSLNKPPIKTYQVEGVTFDCVSLYEQPALDLPLLKNHKIQTGPMSRPSGLRSGTSLEDKRPRARLNRIDCPQGTVPIRRTQKEDLIRAKTFSGINIRPQTTDFPGQHLAILKLANIDNRTFHGSRAYINVYNVTVGPNQSSSARVWVENGPTGQVNSLQAGWIVAPQLLGDNRTRLFASWSENGGKTSCFNTQCSGFIQIDKNHALGDGLSPTSTYGGDQYVIHVLVFQDNVTGHWWLNVNEVDIGYWPRFLLPHLAAGHLDAAYGGLVNGPPNEVSAPMGNGYFPKDDFYKACYFCMMQLVNESNYLINISEDRVEKYMDCEKAYYLAYYGYVNKELAHAILFGGPGATCGV